MAEDIGIDLACYGEPAVKTPILDSLAASGLRFSRCYSSSPICSTNRSSMMTGMHQNAIGAQDHRSHRGDGYQLPAPVEPITSYLKEAGYYCAIGCGYGAKLDLNFEHKRLFDGNDWSKRAKGQPFFAQIQLEVTHRGDWWEDTRAGSKSPIDPATVRIPPQFPDHPELREDWANYLDTIEVADRQVGEILQRLEEEGLSENTVVFFIGDNGRCQIRGKGYLYEEGIKVPLIVSWPRKILKNEVREDLVTTYDISAQILELAGVDVPEHLHGRSFLDGPVQERGFVVAARDRWDEIVDKIRCVVSKKYKYIRNDMPLVPYDAGQVYVEENRPFLKTYRALNESGELNEYQAAFLADSKPAEELYDLESDPWELRNLAGEQQYASVKSKMARVLQEWEVRIGDYGRVPEKPENIQRKMLERLEVNSHMKRALRANRLRVSSEGSGAIRLSYADVDSIQNGTSVRYGYEVWLQAEPDIEGGSVTVESVDVECKFDPVRRRYRFLMPSENVDIKVTFK